MTDQPMPVSTKLSFSYKFYWGVAALGTSLISGIYGGLLTIFYQDYLGLTARYLHPGLVCAAESWSTNPLLVDVGINAFV